jgi:hypothetical protein
MKRELQHFPGNARFVVPLGALSDFRTHKQQLLAGMRPHQREKCARVGELPPFVTGHFAEQRSLTVNHLIMRNRQNEILGEGVEQAEGDLVVFELAIDRVLAEVTQHVVHPTHVPLHGEAEPVR